MASIASWAPRSTIPGYRHAGLENLEAPAAIHGPLRAAAAVN
jgi:hypothetical protein